MYFKDKVKEDNSGVDAKKGDETICTTTTVHNYIDWYRYTYDAWGNLLSVVYLYTEYVDSSSTTSCVTEFQPDQPIRTPVNPIFVSCQDGSGRTNCVRAAEPQIFCEVGFRPDENGNCVEVQTITRDNFEDFGYSDALELTDEQQDWINHQSNKAVKDAITAYLQSFIFTPQYDNAKGFAYQSIFALFTNSLLTLNNINFDDQIINELTGKADCIYDELVKSGINNHNLIRETFIKFGDGNLTDANLTYKLQSPLVNSNGVVLNGATLLRSGNNYTVILNSDRINNRAPIEIAKTIIHESLHALLQNHYHTGTESFIELFGKYMEENTGSNHITHAIMRDHYVASISNTLKQFDNNQETQQFYDDLAWEGLHQFLPQADIDRIIQTIKTARSRGINCN